MRPYNHRLLLLASGLALTAVAAPACKKTPPPQEPVVKADPPPKVVEDPGPKWPDEPYRAQAPAPGPISPLQLPAIKTFELESGVDVFLVSQDKLPTVYMFFEWDLGEADDPVKQAGLHDLCMDLIDEGTRRLDKVAFEEAQADQAISIWSGGGRETSTAGLRALKDQLGPGLDLFAEMLREPGLRQKDLDRLRERRKAGLLQQRGTPAAIAGRLGGALLWGADHPYGHVETEASYDAVKLGDCKKVAGKLRPDGARLFVVGMVTEEELRAALGERLGKWKGKAAKAKAIPAAKPRSGTIFLVDVPGAAQSVISIGHPGPARKADDYESTHLMAQILGGSFSSRINMNLREDKGFAYGGRGGYAYTRDGSTFSAGASVRTDATGQSLREIKIEIDKMRASEPTPEELRREQEGAIQALPATFSTPTRTLMAFRSLVYYGLGLDWYSGYTQRIGAVNQGSIHKAAEEHLQAGDQVVLVVGDAAVIQGDLQAIADEKLFGAGGLVILDADGKPVKAGAAKATDKATDKPAPAKAAGPVEKTGKAAG